MSLEKWLKSKKSREFPATYFRTCELYKSLYNEFYSQPQEIANGEKYVAPLYDYLLSKGGEIYISDIAPEKVHVLGTPDELRGFLEGKL